MGKRDIELVGKYIDTNQPEDKEKFEIDGSTLVKYTGNNPDVVVPEFITDIGPDAFNGCDFLKSIKIPTSVKSIGEWAFNHCSNLTSITIPSGVECIEFCMFSGCSSLTSITIPDGVTSIYDHAFCGCESLTNIMIPDSVTDIGAWIFEDCKRLMSISFKGTKEQWNAIDKGNDWDYNTGDYTIHCTDGDIAKADLL